MALRHARYRLVGGGCVQTEGLDFGTYALQIEIVAGSGLASLPVAVFSHSKTTHSQSKTSKTGNLKATRWMPGTPLRPETEGNVAEKNKPN